QAWLRTWAVDPQNAADVAWKMTRGTPIWSPSIPLGAFDSPDERRRVGELFDRYDREGLIGPEVDEGFAAVASERRARDPIRYYVTLPLHRAVELWWNPVPEWELPCAAPSLHLPEGRGGLEPHTRRGLLLAIA